MLSPIPLRTVALNTVGFYSVTHSHAVSSVLCPLIHLYYYYFSNVVLKLMTPRSRLMCCTQGVSQVPLLYSTL